MRVTQAGASAIVTQRPPELPQAVIVSSHASYPGKLVGGVLLDVHEPAGQVRKTRPASTTCSHRYRAVIRSGAAGDRAVPSAFV